jgi:hypothetical protein
MDFEARRCRVIPEVDKIVIGLTAVEDQINERGWDMPPLLFAGAMSRGSKGDVLGFTAMPDIAPLDDHVPTALKKFLALSEDASLAGRGWSDGDPLAAQGFAGCFLSVEQFIGRVDPNNPQQLDKKSAREQRTIYGVDPGGRLYVLTRVRCGEPEVEVFRPGSPMFYVGDMIESLILLCKSFCRSAPPDSWDVSALNALLREVKELRSRGSL